MAIIEQDLQSGDSALWHPQREYQPDAKGYNMQPSSISHTLRLGDLQIITTCTALRAPNTVSVNAFIFDLDAVGEIIPASGRQIGEGDILKGNEINEANLVFGEKRLSYIPDTKIA